MPPDFCYIFIEPVALVLLRLLLVVHCCRKLYNNGKWVEYLRHENERNNNTMYNVRDAACCCMHWTHAQSVSRETTLSLRSSEPKCDPLPRHTSTLRAPGGELSWVEHRNWCDCCMSRDDQSNILQDKILRPYMCQEVSSARLIMTDVPYHHDSKNRYEHAMWQC